MSKQRGYSLPMVLLVLSVLGISLSTLTFVHAASSKSTGSIVGRRTGLYVCDGVVRGLTLAARDYFSTTATPTGPGLRDHLCGAGTAPLCPPVDPWFGGWDVEDITVGTGAVNDIGEVPTGPFRGQTARRADMSIAVQMAQAGTGRRCRVEQKMVNSQIGLFQFAIFSSIPMDLYNPPTMDIRGRTHINGDFCAGGGPLTFDRITVAGVLRSGCASTSLFGSMITNGFSIRDGGGTPQSINSGNDGDETSWRADALSTWDGNALDTSHGVPFLRLPVATGGPTQSGGDQNGNSITNADTLRLMVDPPRAADSVDVAGERMANKADIRIINGVWFKNDGTFPGIPIWSDHQGAYTPTNTHETAQGLMPGTVPAAPAAKRFSYYERNGVGAVDDDSAVRSVVSYGAIVRDGSRMVPAFRSGGGIVKAVTDADLTAGVRTGFLDGRARRDVGGAPPFVLPMNIDVAALVEAFTDPNANELGGLFNGGVDFNGIIWVTNTWPNSHREYGTSTLVPAAPSPSRTGNPNETDGVPLAFCRGVAACTSTATHINALRIMNAATIDPAVLPRGLTIVTNTPLYVHGDVNTGSLVAGLPGTPRTVDPTGTWVPMMLAGDAVTVQSNAWSDAGNGRPLGAGVCAPENCTTATTTHIVSAVLAGHVQTAGVNWGGGINNFPRFLENWSGVPSRITGSLVIGFRSVHARDVYANVTVYAAPQRFWSFDTNFANPAHQPPGTPSFFVQAVERWQRN